MENIFTGLSLVVVAGTIMAMFMRLIHQPLVIGHILTGILVGPAAFHLIKDPTAFTAFSDIGIALLLFIIGLGLNPQVVNEVSKVAGTAGILQVGITTLVAWGGALALGLDQTEALFLGIALGFSSTIIILKLLADKKEQLRLYGKIATGVTLTQDMVAALALLFVIAKGQGSVFSLLSVGTLAAKGMAVGAVMILVSRLILSRIHKFIASNQELLFLFAIAWGFGSSALFQKIGFSHEIGALFAGILLADLPYAQEISSRLRPLRDFFIILFFITLGAGLTFGAIENSIPLIIFGTLVVVIIKPLAALSVIGAMGYTKRTSFKAALTLGQASEFSIIFIVLGQKQGLVSADTVTALTVVALISFAITTYLITYLDQLYKILERPLTFFERSKTNREIEHHKKYELVLFGYHRGGHEFLKVFHQLKKPYVVVDYDPETIATLEHQKINYLFGDAGDIELLEEASLSTAKLIVSTMTDHPTTKFLLDYIEQHNPEAVSIFMAETPEHAIELYGLGASYVMLPHYMGSEKISSFIRRVGFKKSEFKKIREKHLQYIEAQLALFDNQEVHEHHIGQTILKNLTPTK